MKYLSDSYRRLKRHTRAMRRAIEAGNQALAERHLIQLIGEWALHLGRSEFYDANTWSKPESREQQRDAIRAGLATIASNWPTMRHQDLEQAVMWLGSAFERERQADQLRGRMPLAPLDFSVMDGGALDYVF